MYTLRRAATGFKDYLTPSTTPSSPPSSKPSPTPAPTTPSAGASAPSSTPASTSSTAQTSSSSSKSTNIRQTANSMKEAIGTDIDGSGTNDTITNMETLDSPLPESDQDSESGSEHSFAFAEDIDIHGGGDIDAKHDHGYDPRRLHASASQRHVVVASILPQIGKETKTKSESAQTGISGLRVLTRTSRPDTPEVYGLTESEADSDDLEDLDDVDFGSTTERLAQTQRLNSTSSSNLRNHAYPYSHSHYPPFLATSFKPQSRSLRNVHNLESWKAFANNEDISDWSVVRNSKKEIADLHRLREEYEVMLKEKDESMEKERSTWEWIKKDLIEKQREELEDMKTRLEGEIGKVKDDLQKTQTLLDAGNEELEMARQLLHQNTSGGDDSANLAAIDAGINRLKDGYEGRLREKERVIDEQREAHERQRRELTDALRAVEKEMETKEEEWQKERQQMIAANEQRTRAYGYAAQSNAALIEKLRDDIVKMEALLDSRTKELEKAQSQLKKIQAKWKEVQDRGRREVSNDADKLPSPLRVDVRKLFQAPNVQSATCDASTASSGISTRDLKGRLPTKPSFPATSNSSVEDVKRLLETLNSDIFQFAAQFTDDIDQLQATDQNMSGFSESRRVEAAKEMSGLLGNGLIGYLTADPVGEDFDTIAQCALQTILLQWCGKVINMWAWSREVNRALKEMYEGMQVAGNHEPARKWRAMTRAQSRIKWEGEWSAIMERITASVMKFLIVVTRGRGISEEDEESKRQLTYQKLSSILGMALQINKIIGEGITSADYEVLCPRPGETFDMRYMVDDNELPVVGKFQTDDEMERKKTARQKIVCTCQLGLRRVIGEPISSLAIQQAIICKVRVLLPSALTDWDTSLKMVE